jgi:hypothetical protein
MRHVRKVGCVDERDDEAARSVRNGTTAASDVTIGADLRGACSASVRQAVCDGESIRSLISSSGRRLDQRRSTVDVAIDAVRRTIPQREGRSGGRVV